MRLAIDSPIVRWLAGFKWINLFNYFATENGFSDELSIDKALNLSKENQIKWNKRRTIDSLKF